MFSSNSSSILLFLLTLYFSVPAQAQQNEIIAGQVRDVNTHQQLRSVNIFLRGTGVGTTSDLAGKFELRITSDQEQAVVVFQHIAYHQREIPLAVLRELEHIDLQPRVIPLSSVEVEEEGVRQLDVAKDIPQTVSVIEARDFEIRGFVDAGDLLRVDHSVQVDEELSGSKTVSIRGGNPDEVVVLYNGVKMNNAYNNVFDLSLIDLEDVERFELIKGSNTALYGPEAFSGVVNIVPKLEQDYTIRFQQRFGTYRSGNWGLHLYKRFNRLYGSYSIKRGGLTRAFADNNGDLENSSLHHTATLNYDIGTNDFGQPKGTLGAMWVYSSLDYQQVRNGQAAFDNFTDDVNDFNHLMSMRYNGEIFGVENFDISGSYKNLDHDEVFVDNIQGPKQREILDQAYILNLRKQFVISNFEWLVAYQFEQNKLDESNEVRIQDLSRLHNGVVGVVKYHGDTGSDFLQTTDVDLSIRHDRVSDRQDRIEFVGDFADLGDEFGVFEGNDWTATNFKFSLSLSGYRENLSMTSFLNFGANTKFPTLFQQSQPADLDARQSNSPTLQPEKNRSFEVGLNFGKDVRDNSSIYGWQISSSYFQNHYDNKFREFYRNPGDPVPSYDNVQNANINGFEGKGTVYLFNKKVSAEIGISKYFLSEQSAFPFKSDHKRSLTIGIDHAGYAFQMFWFKEGEQVGVLRNAGTSDFTDEIPLESRTNLDLHLSKTFEFGKLRLFANASGRNLLNDSDILLEGLAIYDRRVYLTLGAQY